MNMYMIPITVGLANVAVMVTAKYLPATSHRSSRHKCTLYLGYLDNGITTWYPKFSRTLPYSYKVDDAALDAARETAKHLTYLGQKVEVL